MTEERLYEWIDPPLRLDGAEAEPGVDLAEPAILIERIYRRGVRWNRLPILGRGLSVVAVVRQPAGLPAGDSRDRELLTRIARGVCDRYSPWKAAVIGLTGVVLTSEPIRPDDEAAIDRALGESLRQFRVVPFGLFRVNLDQESLAFSLRTSPAGLFTEPQRLADILSEKLRRFVPPFEL